MRIPYVEVEITDHCNLRCANCTHMSPYMNPGFYPLEQFDSDVKNLASAGVRFDSIRIMGGEPLLNPNAAEYASLLRQSGMFDRIGMATNGTLLEKADGRVFELLDFVDVVIYPAVEDRVRLERLSVYPNLKVTPMFPRHFWAEDFKGRIEDGAIVERIWQDCGMKYCNAIYQGYYVQCVQTYRKPKFMAKMGLPTWDWQPDGVRLDSPTLAADLERFLGNRRMPEACNYCLGQSGKDVLHHQQPLNAEIGFFSKDLLKW